MSDSPELAYYNDPEVRRRREYARGLENLRNPIVREWLEKRKRSLTPVEFVRAMATFCERPPWADLSRSLIRFTDGRVDIYHQSYWWSGYREHTRDGSHLLTDAEFNRLLSPWIGPPPPLSNEEIGWILRNQLRGLPPATIVREMAKLTELPLSRFHIRSGLLWINPSIDRSVQVQAEKWNAVRPRWGARGSLSDEQFNELLSPWIFPPPQRPLAVYR